MIRGNRRRRRLAPIQHPRRAAFGVQPVLADAPADEGQRGGIVVAEADPKPQVHRGQTAQTQATAQFEHFQFSDLGDASPAPHHGLGEHVGAGPEVGPVGHVVVLAVPGVDRRIVEQPIGIGGPNQPDRTALDVEGRDRHGSMILRAGLSIRLFRRHGPSLPFAAHQTSRKGTNRRKCSLNASASRSASGKSASGLVASANDAASWPRFSRNRPKGTVRSLR